MCIVQINAMVSIPGQFANMLMLLYVCRVEMDQLMLICANPLRSTLNIISLLKSGWIVEQREEEKGRMETDFKILNHNGLHTITHTHKSSLLWSLSIACSCRHTHSEWCSPTHIGTEL